VVVDFGEEEEQRKRREIWRYSVHCHQKKKD